VPGYFIPLQGGRDLKRSMNKTSSNYIQGVGILFLSAGAVLALFLWQGHQGFNLWDEGFLWYGVQRVMVGEVPIRDFMAYDPGRYYWSAALMGLWGDNGIMSLRVTIAVFQATGLFIGLSLLARSSTKPNFPLWILAAITFAVWMFPRHKLFDISISIALVGALSFLIHQPSSRRYFLAGLSVGLAAVFGRNHGMYGVAGSLGVMTFLALKRDYGPGLVKSLAIWTSGVVLGYLPVLFLIAVIPHFAPAFLESIRFLFEVKTTNLPLPVPWPWNTEFDHVSPLEAARGVVIGLFFIAIIAFGVLGIAWAIRQKLRGKFAAPALVASIFLALPYAHVAYSRADVGHLAQGIFPFLIGGFVLLASQPAKIKWPFAALLTAASMLVMLPLHPGWQCQTGQPCVETNIAGDMLNVDRQTANDLAILHSVASRFAPGDRAFIAAPFWPGAYATLERKSPMWEIYALFPRGEAFEQAEIERIRAADPGFAIVLDLPLDGRDELRFHNTHPTIDQYIRDHFDPVTGYSQNPAYQLYRSRKPAQ
jgi:hypothetical protein